MCTKSMLFEKNTEKEGVYTAIKAKSYEKAEKLVAKHLKEEDQKSVFTTLSRIKKLIDEHQNDEPQAITVTLCVNNICTTIEFWEEIELDIRIEINF